MPVTVHADLRRLEQVEFAQVAYEVMGHVFKVHAEFGRFLREEIYHSEIARRSGGLVKVPIEVCHRDFTKFYYVDLLVAAGAPFELKTARTFTDQHRSQLLHYLLLAGLAHGKLINLRPESVQHEFVNTSLTLRDRTAFSIHDSNWDSSGPRSFELKEAAVGLLADLGSCLSVSLYEEALIHLSGGEKAVLRDVEIYSGGHLVGKQPASVISPDIAFRVTAVAEQNQAPTEDHLRRFLTHTSLQAIQWINIRQDTVTFKTIHRER